MNWWTRILDFISPRQCVVCGQRLAPSERTLCLRCILHLPRTGYQHHPLDNPMAQAFWGLVPIERTAALFFFQPHSELANMVYQLKYNQRPDIGEDMGRLMASEMLSSGFFDGVDVMVPVPLSSKRMRQRGYNQSECLAEGIRQLTAIPIVKALRRKHFQQSQTQLRNRGERRNNVEGTFLLTHPKELCNRHVLLVDDVCTTGATLTACAEALKGVENVKISILTLGFTKN